MGHCRERHGTIVNVLIYCLQFFFGITNTFDYNSEVASSSLPTLRKGKNKKQMESDEESNWAGSLTYQMKQNNSTLPTVVSCWPSVRV